MKDICFAPTLTLTERNEVVRILQLTSNSINKVSYTSAVRHETHSNTMGMNTGKQTVHNLQQRVIREKTPTGKTERCQCEPNTKCGDLCLNRATYIECDVNECPCGNSCTNNRIQRGIFPRIEKFDSGDKGWGVRSVDKIQKESLIVEYVGEVRTVDRIRDKDNVYILQLSSSHVIDAQSNGNIARFVNHSCEPNARMDRWYVNGRIRMVLTAKHDIFPGEEITFDYQFESFDSLNLIDCKCNSGKCRGKIGAKVIQNSRAKAQALQPSNKPTKSASNPLSCDCGLIFTKASSLNRHRMRIHGTSRDFVCTECNKSFLHHDNLTQHEKTHFITTNRKNKKKGGKKIKKPKCKNCGMSFTKMTSLKRHEYSKTCNKEN